MASKNYDEYEVEQLIKSKKQGDDYAAQRKAQADEAVKTSDGLYDTAIATTEKNYAASAKETESGYRRLYDANAVQELVARRNVEEAMANMGLTDSGLNRTQQTAISLQRGRADSQASQQKQSALDAIMRELDARRAELQSQKTAAGAGIQSQADADILNFRNSADAAARQNAASLYAADQEAEAARYAAEQEAATKQAQMLLDAQKAQSDERIKMLGLGYEWSDEAGGYVKPNSNLMNGDLTTEQMKLVADYAKDQGISFAEAKAELYGKSIGDPLFGYDSLHDAARDYYVNGNTTGKAANESEQHKKAVESSIKSESEARYSGDLRIHRTYPAYVASVITDALVSGKLTADEAAELRIELEAENGWDLGPYMQFGALK